MRIAFMGPTDRRVADIERYIPEETREMVTADLRGVCHQALKWADLHNLPRVIVTRDFVPADQGKSAYLRAVVSEVDLVVLLDDRVSSEVRMVKQYAKLMGKALDISYI